MSRTDDENDGQATERVVIRDRRKINLNGEDTTVTKEPEEQADEQPREP